LTDDDLPLLHAWLNEPGVVEWWEGDDVSWDAVVADYGSSNPDPTEHWLALLDGEPFGWVQLWLAVDEQPYVRPWWALGAHRSVGGIDYLVGPVEGRGRGLGSSMLRAFVDDVGFGLHPQLTQIGASPSPGNTASWRALEKAGFRPVGVFDAEHGPEKLHLVDRPGTPSLRTERAGDEAAIHAVVAAAFPTDAEARLVDALRADPDAWLPDLSVVAERDGDVVGHVLVSQVHLGDLPVLGLAPLAVHPDHQRGGVGAALVHEALARAEVAGGPLVVVLGDPAYYGRFGFVLAPTLGDHQQVHFLRRRPAYPPAFDAL
jgi:predicted N-acetyltransferase YhbS/RimJ/RimL family protein N-acetyltransferase